MAIYRDFRPKTFDEVLGQDATIKVLKNQIKTGNISHAYIFSGIRGSGKTSSAKIFSRAVNCLNPKDGNPCNECEACKSILNGETIDVVEMDAASNRKIDDIRDLREKVMYPPSFLKYKVYIIDEAHMITNEAFNALLKIMEDAPSHLIFILATTELSKIPETIQSRCQRFNFQRINDEMIAYSLKNISKKLGYNLSDGAISQIVKASNGALRDSQSILDKVISSSSSKEIDEMSASRAIGLTESYLVRDICSMILNRDLRGCFILIDKIYSELLDAKDFLGSILETFRGILLYKYGIDQDFSKEDIDFFEKYKDVGDEKLIFFIDTLLEDELRIKTYELKRVILESSMVKLVNFEGANEINSRLLALEEKMKSPIIAHSAVDKIASINYDFEKKLKEKEKNYNSADDIFSSNKNMNEAKETKESKETKETKETKEIKEKLTDSKIGSSEAKESLVSDSDKYTDLKNSFKEIFKNILEKNGELTSLNESLLNRLYVDKIKDSVIFLSYDIDIIWEIIMKHREELLDILDERFNEKFSISKHEPDAEIKEDLLNYFEGKIKFK